MIDVNKQQKENFKKLQQVLAEHGENEKLEEFKALTDILLSLQDDMNIVTEMANELLKDTKQAKKELKEVKNPSVKTLNVVETTANSIIESQSTLLHNLKIILKMLEDSAKETLKQVELFGRKGLAHLINFSKIKVLIEKDKKVYDKAIAKNKEKIAKYTKLGSNIKQAATYLTNAKRVLGNKELKTFDLEKDAEFKPTQVLINRIDKCVQKQDKTSKKLGKALSKLEKLTNIENIKNEINKRPSVLEKLNKNKEKIIAAEVVESKPMKEEKEKIIATDIIEPEPIKEEKETISSYNNFNKLQREQIRLGKENNVDTSIYEDSRFNDKQMEQIRLGLQYKDMTYGIDVSKYANPEFKAEDMEKIKDALIHELVLDLDYCYADSFGECSSIGIRKNEAKENTKELIEQAKENSKKDFKKDFKKESIKFEKNSIKFERALNRITDKDFSKDKPYFICDRTNPDNFIQLKSSLDKFNEKEYTKTNYTVYKDNKSVGKFSDERFEGRPRNFWIDLRNNMKQLGKFKDDMIIFDNKEAFKEYKELYKQHKQKSSIIEKLKNNKIQIQSAKTQKTKAKAATMEI